MVSALAHTAAAQLDVRFGPDVRVAVDVIEPSDHDLLPAERAFVIRAVAKRRYDFAAGRRLARRLLGNEVALLPTASRAPDWPAGVRGSIAHAGSLCVVVVAESGPSVGVDVEPFTPMGESTARLICSPAERATHADPLLDAKRVFCAKEAFYKAQWPLTNLALGFMDAHVTLTDDTFEVEPLVETTLPSPLSGFFVYVEDYVFAGITIRAS